MERLNEVYAKCVEYSQYISNAQSQMINNYLGEIYVMDGERYRVTVIDITGKWCGFPTVRMQSVKEVSHGMVKEKNLSFEEFIELINSDAEL